MSPLDALNHLLNLFAPAAAMALLLVLGGRLCLFDVDAALDEHASDGEVSATKRACERS